MKIQKIKFKKNKLLKLYLIQNKIYIKNLENFVFDNDLNINLEYIEVYLKKALKIIYEFHNNNRKILFIGFSKFHFLLNDTPHYYVPEKIWINGIINNRRAILHFLYKKLLDMDINHKKFLFFKNIKVLLNIKFKPDLIVICNPNFNINLMKEFFNLDIPIIQFGSNINHSTQILYKIPGNFRFDKKQYLYNNDFLLYIILKKILKKKFSN